MSRHCPQCGEEEGCSASWRYVDGRYQHKCRKDPYMLGHYYPDYGTWQALGYELMMPWQGFALTTTQERLPLA